VTERDRSESTGIHAAVDLGSASSFAVLAGSGITNTGPTTVAGDLGSHPTPPAIDLGAIVCAGVEPAAASVTRQAKIDLATAYSVAAGMEPSTSIAPELGGMTLSPGVYRSASMQLTGTLSLDPLGDPGAVFVFQTSSLTTSSDSAVVVLGGVPTIDLCWQVAGPVTLGARSSMIGTVLSSTAITVSHAATVWGRLLVLDGGVALDTSTVTAPTPTTMMPATTASRLNPHRRPALPVTGGSASSTPDDPSRPDDRRGQNQLEPGLRIGDTDDETLRSYLDLVRTWRGQGRRSRQPLALRAADVVVLVGILGTDTDEIERRLVEATGCSQRAARRGRGLLLASVSALVISLGAASTVGLVAASPIGGTETGAPSELIDDSPTLTASTAAPEALRSLGAADEVDRSLTPRAVVTRASPPTPSPSVLPLADVAAPPAETTPVAPLPAGTEAVVTIASIGVELPVVPGGQSVIDQGIAAHYWAPGWEPAVAAGTPGTYWLAAHQSTHGGPFRTLPDVALGAEVRVSAGGRTFIYTVTSKQVAGLHPGDDAVYGTDPNASTILLQTCIGSQRLLVRGILTATL
jgi:sortase (surface protein transpeptidase)